MLEPQQLQGGRGESQIWHHPLRQFRYITMVEVADPTAVADPRHEVPFLQPSFVDGDLPCSHQSLFQFCHISATITDSPHLNPLPMCTLNTPIRHHHSSLHKITQNTFLAH